ncbi:hypothetical protein EV681_3517 [Advenella incenata]|jgi:hypothetical protein|uniref:Pentapeptide MXKDX repeat protein n=1 Tax=Advenella incenata TaxID=267800 RepID=A0A4V2FS34_9BURK|nr:hypothetical protein [Advenella incenata]RZT92759.1 hypothetical protein EV681_3517 [Advenella incenata]
MKNTTIAALAGAITLALGMHSGMAADLKVNADSKIDQKPAQHTGATSAPTPGWEKLNKSKKWKSIESGSNQHHANNMKADSKVVPEHQGKSGVTMSHESKGMSGSRSDMHKSGTPDKGQGEHMKSGAAKPAGQDGAMPMQHSSSGMKTDSNVVPATKGEMPKPGM